jgi:membrane-associated phospholipid phosphatase
LIRDHTRYPLYLTQPRVWLLPTIALLGMVLVTVTGTNERVFIFLNKLGPAIGDPLWADLTILGDTAVAMALCLVLARRRPDLLWAALPVALLATAWVHVYKPLFDVTRPPGILAPGGFHVIGPAHHYHSFPSGHATTVFAVAGMCVLGLRLRAAGIVAVLLALLVAISRCVVGVHWPLDILGGACGGWLAAAVGIKAAGRMPFGLHPVVQWALTLAFAGCAVALLLGYDTGYPDAMWFERSIGALSLLAFVMTFVKPRRGPAGSG